MSGLSEEARHYFEQQTARRKHTARMVAFRLATGVDLDKVLGSAPAELQRTVIRLERLLERERLRGCARHWTYDLNRHIALGEALGQLRAALAGHAIRQGNRQ
jgi:hypothetical protein